MTRRVRDRVSDLAKTENLLRMVLTALIGLGSYEVRSILHRIERLEVNQTRIMVHLGVDPGPVQSAPAATVNRQSEQSKIGKVLGLP